MKNRFLIILICVISPETISHKPSDCFGLKSFGQDWNSGQVYNLVIFLFPQAIPYPYLLEDFLLYMEVLFLSRYLMHYVLLQSEV